MARSHIPYWCINPPTFTDFVPPSYPVKLHSDSATDLTGYQFASTASAKPLRSVFALPVAEAVLPAAAPLTTAGCRTPPFLVPNRSDISPYAHPVHPAAPTGAVAAAPAHLSTPDGLINTDHSTSSNTIPHSTTACFSVFLTHDSLYRRLCGSNSSTSTFSQWCSPHQTPASSSVSVTSQKNGECSKGC